MKRVYKVVFRRVAFSDDNYFFLFSVMGKRLFVGNLPYRVTSDQLNEIFSQNGTVVDVFIPLDRETRRPRGFALVEMSTDEEANAAIEMWNEKELDGRTVKVNEARPMEERPPRRDNFSRGPRQGAVRAERTHDGLDAPERRANLRARSSCALHQQQPRRRARH